MTIKIKELQKELTTFKYNLLISILKDDIKFHRSIGTKFTNETFLNLVDNAYMVIKRF